MHHDFWLERWSEGRIGFHRDAVHPDLPTHADWFLSDGPHRVLVPLCGKSWDVPWFADQGHHVAGAELAESAVAAMFEEHPRPVEREARGDHVVWTSGTLQVWQGDFFTIPASAGPFDRVWDRAALVALRPDMREDYVRQIRRLAPGATVLLSSFDYDPTVMSGPPFPLPDAEVRRLYAADHIEKLDDKELLEAEPQWRERGHEWLRSALYRIRLL